MANIVTLKSFPFDSIQVLNEESGEMVEDRLYEAEIFRKYFAKFLSNGVYYGTYNNYGESSMKVSIDNGLTIKVKEGCGIINGADFELDRDILLVLDRPSKDTRVDRIVVRVDDTLAVRETQLYVKIGNGSTPAELQRDGNIYEICIAEVTVKSSSNITEDDIKDTRLNKDLCGVVSSLIAIDGEELYTKFQNYIDLVTDNLVRKDQDNVTISGVFKDANGGTSKNDFTDEYKLKLDGIDTDANKTIVNNTLTSTSTTQALSAAMGKKLNDEKQKKITYGTSAPSRRF